MIDARRMEVYTALFDSAGKQLTKTESVILNEHCFEKELGEKTVLFTGNGAEKFASLVKSDNAIFARQSPHASGMRILANEKLAAKKFEDCAYFEPFYLKDFVAGKPKKIIDELLLKGNGGKRGR
jgi:tRNA threonylcarbamoyladenosine biosynthesis protein TsaB